MNSSWQAAVNFVLNHEGGEFTDDRDDPGGATRWGITCDDIAQVEPGLAPGVARSRVEGMAREGAAVIYQMLYWKPCGGPLLPAGVDLWTLDYGVNTGSGHAVRTLQIVCGLTNAAADGIPGPHTACAVAGALSSRGAAQLLGDLDAARQAYYRSLRTFWKFGNGWLNRTSDAHAAALGLATVR